MRLLVAIRRTWFTAFCFRLKNYGRYLCVCEISNAVKMGNKYVESRRFTLAGTGMPVCRSKVSDLIF